MTWGTIILITFSYRKAFPRKFYRSENIIPFISTLHEFYFEEKKYIYKNPTVFENMLKNIPHELLLLKRLLR